PRTSTIKPNATAPASCARSTSTAISSRDTRGGYTILETESCASHYGASCIIMCYTGSYDDLSQEPAPGGREGDSRTQPTRGDQPQQGAAPFAASVAAQAGPELGF